MPLVALAFAWASAQDIAGYPLGYCNGEISTTAIVKYAERDVEVSGAIYIPSSYASTVTGNDLKTVKYGIGSTRNISEVTVWVRETLDGANIAEGTPSTAFKQGWNEQNLKSPLTITKEIASKGFYIGYTFKQSYTSAGLAALSVPSEGGMYVKCGGGSWENRSAEGTLCLEGLVYGSTLPRLNVHVEGVTVDKWYIVDRGILNGVITLRNLATETVTSVTIEGKIDGIAEPCSTTVDCNIGYNELVKLPFTLSPGYVSDDPRQISGTFTVTAVNGNADEDETDNSAATTFYVIMEAYPRKVFLEEFTTLQCSNCPRVAGYIHQMLSDPQYSNVVEAVCHHSGFGTDMYTIDADNQYLWFYNAGGSVYAPAIMLDRAMGKFEDTPVFIPSTVEELEQYVDLRLAEPSVISINIEAARTEEDKVDVTVTGNVIDKEAFCKSPRITVYLVEDNIVTDHQAGAGAGYVLEHVTRTVNATWGEALSFNPDNTYSYTCTLELPGNDTYKWDDMKVVAVVANMNVEDVLDCVVENCASITMVEAAGINTIDASPEKEAVIYTIDGRRVESADAPGLYIINGKKVLTGKN